MANPIDSLPVRNDSILLSWVDQHDLYELARKGYFLEKIDSINNYYILTLENKVDDQKKDINSLEVIVEKDDVLVDNLFKMLRGKELMIEKQDLKIASLEQDLKYQKKMTRQAIFGGSAFAAATAALLIGVLSQ